MGEEADLRARIEAQVALRRADAHQPKRDPPAPAETVGEPEEPDESAQPGSAAEAPPADPRSAAPPSPWQRGSEVDAGHEPSPTWARRALPWLLEPAKRSDPVEIEAAEPGSADVSAPESPAPQRRLAVRSLIRLAVLVAVTAVAALLLRAFVVAPYYIPSASMEPTLHGCPGCNNDHVLADKLSYRIHDVRRGDVVVFNRPSSWPKAQVPDKVLVKRVIGLPGDTITARKGIVYINGLALEEPYLEPACPGGTTNFPPEPITVPDGHAFVMGDNRCDSSDSRLFGAIPTSSVIGRAFVIIWPLVRIHWL